MKKNIVLTTEIMVVAGLLIIAALCITYVAGTHNGKWNTITAYESAQLTLDEEYRLQGTDTIIQTYKVSVMHPTLPEEVPWTLKSGSGTAMLERLRNPENIIERIYAYYPDLKLGSSRQIPKQGTPKQEPQKTDPRKLAFK
jgi:hypothetical protein